MCIINELKFVKSNLKDDAVKVKKEENPAFLLLTKMAFFLTNVDLVLIKSIFLMTLFDQETMSK